MANRRKRAEFSKATKIQAKDRAAGNCEQCGAPLMTGKYHFDHVIPTAIKADNSLANCRVVCVACHSAKTKLDVKIIAKARRVEEKHSGIGKAKGWQSKFKKKVDGTVILRETGEPV